MSITLTVSWRFDPRVPHLECELVNDWRIDELAQRAGVGKVAFIGTTVAMSDGFFADRLGRHGLETVMPDPRHHELLNSAIYDELVHGRVVDATRRRVLGVLEGLWDASVGGVLLGCTELELLIKQADADLPVYPCTTLHVNAALDRALAS